MRHYLKYIKDKEMVINVASQICTIVKETLDRKPTYTTRNTINFLNTLSKGELKTMGIKDIIAIITWASNVLGKHHHIESVQAKVDKMLQQVKSFKGLFIELFKKVMPSFWDEHGKLISQFEYQDLLVKNRLGHKTFEDMTQTLSGNVIIDKLVVDFELVDSFRMFGAKLTLIYYVDHVELRVLYKEMENLEVPFGD